MKDIDFQLKVLYQDGYHAAAKVIETLRDLVNREAELVYLTQFAVGNDSGDLTVRKQLRALWTAYCFHANLDVDTAAYDDTLLHLWNQMEEGQTQGWKGFDGFMCRYLV